MNTVNKDGLIRVPNNEYADHNIAVSFKERQINVDKPIFVYRNLRTKGYSVKQFGKVVAHASRLCVKNCEFIVGEKQRQRVIREKQKNVHAFIKGYYTTTGMGTSADRNDLPIEISYNPYKSGNFIIKNNTPIKKLNGARFCILDENSVKASYTF
jgi:hypothetical protein